MVNGGGVDIMTTMERGPAGWNFEERISRIRTVNGKMAPPEQSRTVNRWPDMFLLQTEIIYFGLSLRKELFVGVKQSPAKNIIRFVEKWREVLG